MQHFVAWRTLSALAVAVAVAGCATVPPPPSPSASAGPSRRSADGRLHPITIAGAVPAETPSPAVPADVAMSDVPRARQRRPRRRRPRRPSTSWPRPLGRAGNPDPTLSSRRQHRDRAGHGARPEREGRRPPRWYGHAVAGAARLAAAMNALDAALATRSGSFNDQDGTRWKPPCESSTRHSPSRGCRSSSRSSTRSPPASGRASGWLTTRPIPSRPPGESMPG